MEIALEMVIELHESGQPFLVSVLTLDTHPADYAHEYCDVNTEIAMESVHRCSMEQVATFIEGLDENGILDDTVVVVMGDHLRLSGGDSPFHKALSALEDRTIYNRIWSPNSAEIVTGDIDQLSLYPTILELLGFDLPNGRAGVGVSALRDEVEPGTIRDLEPEEYVDLLRARSADFYDQLWQVESEYTQRDGQDRVPVGASIY